ncbi:lysozyme family protein [Priestia megaterium]|uniref:C40 family peptidase n=1 Tax=Priestia megaterium TaxID=1404 RepID=UPI001F5E8177|nr:C40 family peptidase [Priestia megaterium]
MIEKKSSNQSNGDFRQQKSAMKVLDSTVEAAEKNTPKAMSVTDSKEKSENENSFFGKISENSLIVTKDTLKDGVKKYQRELEKDDEGVKVASQGTTQIYKLSAEGFQKLRKKKFHVKNLKKSKKEHLHKDTGSQKEKPNLKELNKETSLKKITRVPTNVLGNGALKYQQELEKDDEGVKLVSQSATKIANASKKLTKNRPKANVKLEKLNKQNGKLIPFNKNKNLKVESKTILKKKAIKKKMYAPQRATNKAKTFVGFASSLNNQAVTFFKGLTKFNIKNVANLVGTKVAAMFGGGLIGVLPLILVAVICLIIAGMLGAGGSQQEELNANIGGTKNLSPEVEKWRPLVEKEAAAQGMESYVNLLLAIIQVESGGTGTADIMQSSESAGYDRPNVFQTPEASVRQGVTHLKTIVTMLKGSNKGYENNIKLLAQAYNFGDNFARFVAKQGGEYTIEVAEAYSRYVVAPALGNFNGTTVPYVNETSVRVGKTYRYLNGGNFLYGELVSEFIGGGANVSGEFKKVLDEIEKYEGWEYVWGGKSPKTGFDCSGLTSWGLKQIGIDLPSYALSQYQLTEPIDPSEAQPGDLIFFKGTYGGPNHISHVGFYIDENTMYDSEGKGVGYHSWKTPYWKQHFAGIHRIKR